MSGKLTRDAYQKLIDDNIGWLLKQPRSLERDHIMKILMEEVEREYPTKGMEMVQCDDGDYYLVPVGTSLQEFEDLLEVIADGRATDAEKQRWNQEVHFVGSPDNITIYKWK